MDYIFNAQAECLRKARAARLRVFNAIYGERAEPTAPEPAKPEPPAKAA